MRRLGIYEKTPSKKKKYQPTEWITEKFPEEKVQIDVKFVQKECMSPELQEIQAYNGFEFTNRLS